LDKIAEALLEHETIEGKHVLEILEFGEMRSPIVLSSAPKPSDKDKGDKKPAERPNAKGDELHGHGHAAAPTPA
jgi:cell division protease FtsH